MKYAADSLPPQRAWKKCVLRFTALTALLTLNPWQSGAAAEEAMLRYFVVPGDNPWSITERLMHGMQYWQPLLRLNKIDRPRQLPPGSALMIPVSWLKTEAANVRVKEVVGSASYISAADGLTKPLQSDALLSAGDQINIGDDATAVIEYADGSMLFLGRNTQVILKRVEKFSDTGLADSELELKSGRTENRIIKRGTRFEITTPSASTAVRGTDFRTSIDSEETKLSRIEVLSGSVAVAGSGRNRNIAAGYGTTVQQGEPPTPPKALLQAPKFETPEEYSRKFPVEIKWQTVKGAQKYRLQIRADGSGISLLDEVTTRTGVSTDLLGDGRWRLHLRAIDSAGLEGVESTRSLLLDAQPQPPLTVTPESEQVVRSELPTFEWTRPVGISRIHFQLLQDKQAAPLLDFKDFSGNRFTPEALAPGDYIWRLASQSDTEEGPYSENQPFTLKPAPSEPQVSSEGDDTRIRLRWPNAGEGRTYQVQFAQDSEFQSILQDQHLELPLWEAERPAMLSYFRVRTVESDGYTGAWSTTQMIDPVPTPWYQLLLPTALLLLLAL